MFKKLSAKFHLAMGLASMLVSVLMAAMFLNLIPDRQSAVLESRASLTESVASITSLFLQSGDFTSISQHLDFLVERNTDLLAAQVLRISDNSDVTIGDASVLLEQENGSRFSTAEKMLVPLQKGGEEWGSVTLAFSPIAGSDWLSVIKNSRYTLIAFAGLFCFIAYYIYLGKMLKQLNPSAAVPGRVRSALDTIAESLLVINRKGEIVLANTAFAKLAGSDPELLLGRNAEEFEWGLAEDDEDGVLPWEKALHSVETTRNDMLWLVDASGDRRKFIVNCSPVMGGNDKPGGVLISLDDVTLLEQTELELRASKEEAELANQAKSSFLSNMSHEIRTPMTAILGFTEVLKRGYSKDPKEAQRHLATIASSGEHLLELINDVLDLSKVESGALDIEETDCQPHVIIQDVMTVLNVKAEEKGIYLKYDFPEALPKVIQSDPSRLRQIVTNLVGNAIKFTAEGGVTISLTTAHNGTNDTVSIAVADTGIGMTEKQAASVFEAFVQADSSITRRFGGTGLGLSISRQLAIAMGGGIAVASEPDKGSVFTATVDAGELDKSLFVAPEEIIEALEKASHSAHYRWDMPEANILVVDDGAENRELISLVLSEHGFTVETAENGQIGVDKFVAGEFDIVLMDIQMPVLDGYQAVAKLRELGVTVPVVALTANAMKGFEKKVLEAGFSHYQTKPIDFDKLNALLADLLGGEQVEIDPSEINNEAQFQTLASAANDATDENRIVNELVDSNAKFKPIADEFRKRLNEKIPDMRSAIDRADLEEVASLAHWLKGSGGSVGYKVFTRPATLLENAAKAGEKESLTEPFDTICDFAKQLEIQEGSGTIQTLSKVRYSETGSGETANSDNFESADYGEDADTPIESTLPLQNPRFAAIVEQFHEKLFETLKIMDQAWVERDFDTLADRAHWLKGSGGNVGFKIFTKPAGLVETLAKEEDESGIEDLLAELKRYADRIVVNTMDQKKSA